MEEDERYWSGPSTLKAFDFEDGPQRDESVLKLFGMGGGGAASNHPHQDGIPLSAISPDDMDLHSSTSDEVSSVRSESVIEEAPKSSSFAKNLKDKVIRTRSTLSSSRSTASSIVPSVPVRVPSSPTFSATSNKSYVKPVQMVQPPEILVRQRSDSSASNSQLQSEIQYLRRNLEARKDQWIKLSPKEMVWRIVRNLPYGLENYRSLEEKIAVLDQALNLYDSNAIIVAVLHMTHTLSHEMFVREMLNKPDAMDQYISFLMADSKWEECLKLFDELGRTEDSSCLHLRTALKKHEVQDKLKGIEACIKRLPTSPSPGTTTSSDYHRLRSFKSLLELQRPIDDNDERASKDPRNEVFAQFPRLRSLVGMSLMETLSYCCMYHFDKPETNFCSPHYLRKHFAISEKQFLWTALNALSKTQKWTEIQALLTDRVGWFGHPKPRAVIGFDKVVDILLRNKTPPDVLAYYLRLIDDPEVRLEYSRKSKCHSVTIDTLGALKQFDELQDYGSKLESGSPEYRYLQEVLHKVKV